MSHLLRWLTDNVRNAASRCGAVGASVYVPTPWDDAVPGILVHVGETPLPEMFDLDHAHAFATAAGDGAGGFDGQPMLVKSAAAEGRLIPIPMLATHWRGSAGGAGTESRAPQRRLADDSGAPPIVGWLGLRFARPPGPLQLDEGWSALLEIASALASTYVCFYGILTDPVTGLPGRAELHGTLRAELERAQIARRPLALLFLRMESLEAINQRHGRRAGDHALRELIGLLQDTLRASDVVMRYGAATFALPLRDVTAEGALIVAAKLRERFLVHPSADTDLPLLCAIGAVSVHGSDTEALQPLDLLRRADQALAASCRDPQRRPVLWQADDVSTSEPLDPLLGVFTGQAEKDYRNMRLLWEVLQVLADTGGGNLAEAAVTRICTVFSATRVALFQPDDRRRLQLVAGRHRPGGGAEGAVVKADDLSAEERDLNERAYTSEQTQYATVDGAFVGVPGSTLGAVALPLVVDGRVLGTLYLLSFVETRKLDQSDLPVLSGVATHLALALDREHLAAQQRQHAETEKARLRAEVERLQAAVQQSKLVFRSPAMVQLLDTTRRVAATDATVLVTGESGTGKEMLAHALHELSGRHKKPLVIVDCGAIPASLMDSELFGRERGAYTGAERRAVGRLAQADGGTVFLDEIGELPLEVQAKLLRFVQERTITMVGSTSAQRIDVRIIAATNRVLEHEVQAGRFREDLFHRLNVVRVRIPPLRERQDDVLLLARHFLDAFAMQYGKSAREFTADAEALLLAHGWSGNVRELQNTILQAVVLTHGDRITTDDLRLSSGGHVRETALIATAAAPAGDGRTRTPIAHPVAPPVGPHASPNDPATAAWCHLRERLSEQVAAACGDGNRPLGKWLGYEVVLQANEDSRGVLTRAATRVGLPQTTFVRRLRQAESEAANIRYPESWLSVRTALLDLIQLEPGEPHLADRIDDLLFELTVTALPRSIGRAAALIGISLPTMKRRMAEFEARQAACA